MPSNDKISNRQLQGPPPTESRRYNVITAASVNRVHVSPIVNTKERLTPFWVGNNLQSCISHTQFCGEADLSQYRFILYSVLDIGYCESHLMIRAGEGGRNDVQGSAKGRGLGCVNSLPGSAWL